MKRIAVVTGSSYGMGKSIANVLLDNGFKVYGLSRGRGEIKHKNFVWIKIDLSITSNIQKLFIQEIKEDHIDLLVNNAGIYIGENGLDYHESSFENIFSLNFQAPIVLTNILQAKLQNSIVINISSISERIPAEESGLYSASKAALDMFFDCLALEEKQIKFISILPSYVDTPLLENIWDGLEAPFDWKTIVKPEHISTLIRKITDSPQDFESGLRIIVITESLKDGLQSPKKVKVFQADIDKIIDLSEVS